MKLAGAGLSDDQIAALDGDWSEFSAAERAAFAMARKLTYEPHLVNSGDVEQLRKHYTDSQVLEIVFTIAGNNATNRWKEALGIPQEKVGRHGPTPAPRDEKPKPKVFLTPTSERYREKVSVIAPLVRLPTGEVQPVCVVAQRPPLEPRNAVEAALAACRQRRPLVPLASEDQARALLPDRAGEPMPNWVRLLATFPREGKGRILGVYRLAEHGNITPRLRAQVNWIAARHDRAWYALGQARKQLLAAGVAEEEMYALDGSWQRYTPAERAAFSLVRKMTVAPFQLVDDDIAACRKHFTDAQCVELVLRGSTAAFFNRVTEGMQLPLE